ncbi:MAG: hypothetical protein H7839_13585 [Magnetococcus sp. YQC-5]
MSIIMHERLYGREVATRICTATAYLDPNKIYTIILQSPNEAEGQDPVQTEPQTPNGKWTKVAARFSQQGALSSEAAEHLRKAIQEFRDNFNLYNDPQ